jgi:signal transduction histidine kinase
MPTPTNPLADSRIDALEQRIAELDAFVYTIAHELRAPLHTISGFAASLEHFEAPNLSGKGRWRLKRVVHVAAQMERLIDDLLSLARSDRMEIVKAPTATDETVRDILRELRQAYPATRVVVSELPLVHADAAIVRQVFLNVIGNALKYSHLQAEPLVQIGLDAGGAFRVSDNGIGFPMEQAARLFIPFERMTGDPAYPGSGVGLAVVLRLLTRHGGWIKASSREGGPTEFRFSFGGD